MPKTFPIRLEVEEAALGPVLRRLHEMAGIAKLHLDLGHGGTKPATKSNGSGELQSQIIAALMHGQMTALELVRATGLGKRQLYGVVHNLKQKRFIKSVGKGTYVLVEKAKKGLLEANAVPRLTPSGRVAMGAGEATLLACLQKKAMRPIEIGNYFREAGAASPKSLSGIMDRARRDGLIKKQGLNYALTAKGRERANG